MHFDKEAVQTIRDIYRYLKENPKEAERMNQCFNCAFLPTCERGDEAEDENKMCRFYKQIGT